MFQKNPVSKYSTFQNIWFMIKLSLHFSGEESSGDQLFYRTVNHYYRTFLTFMFLLSY